MPTTDKFRVLIVDDIAETRDMISRMLQFDASIEVIGAARTGRDAVELTSKLTPDVVIMDINMPDMDGITATENIRRKVPYVQVVILSVQSDPNYMRRAMLAGARDFLAKPPNIDDLTAAVHRAGKMAQDERSKAPPAFTPGAVIGPQSAAAFGATRGKIIVCYSPKGGTGCTAIATNLAIHLHTNDSKVILVDGNLMYGDVAVFLNVQGKNTILDLTPRVDELDQDVIHDVVVEHPTTGLNILSAPPRPGYAEEVTGEQFSKLLKYLAGMYAYVVVDTSSYLTEVVQEALDIADIILLITTQDIPAIKNSNLFLSIADAVKIDRNRILFIMNRFDKRITISPDKVGESLRQPMVAVIPFDERIVSNSINRGIPFMLDNKTSTVGKSIQSLADTIRERIKKLDTHEAEPTGKK